MKYTGLFVIVFCLLRGQVVITEVMYNLPGADSPNEFVEIVNLSPLDTVNLRGYSIRDRYTTDALVDSGYGLTLAPGQYGLILEGDYSFSEGIYSGFIPDSVVLIKVDDSSIGNGLSGTDSLYLLDTTGQAVDSVGWTDRADPGFSLEKIRLERPNRDWNWAPSVDSLGTPGRPNSVRPLAINGAILNNSPLLLPDTLEPDEMLSGGLILYNPGIESVGGNLHILVDLVETEWITIDPIPELDTLAVQLSLGPWSGGYHDLTVVWDVEGDGDTTDNVAGVVIGVRYQPGDGQLNEFLPTPTEEQVEFLEWVAETPLNLYRWSFTDSRLNHFSRITTSMSVAPHQYIVLAADSSLIDIIPDTAVVLVPANWSSLNNNGDAIRLLDPFGTVIDTLSYTTGWGLHPGQSMEKRLMGLNSADSTSWAPCQDSSGWTPGRKNSIHPLWIDGVLDHMSLVTGNAIPDSTTPVTVEITVKNSGLSSVSGTVLILEDGYERARADLGNLIPSDSALVSLLIGTFAPGRHVLTAEWDLPSDGDVSNNRRTDTLNIRYPWGTVRFNEFFPLPNNDQTEFVELVPFRTLGFTGWSLADSRYQPVIIPGRTISARKFLVVAADSRILSKVPENTEVVILDATFPTLNNSGDALYLLDPTGTVIDSLVYSLDWPLEAERSVEKISPTFPSYESSSWLPCVDSDGQTPGRANSVLLNHRDGKILHRWSWTPVFPEPKEVIQCTVWVTNRGLDPIMGSISVELNDEELGEVSVPTLERQDTVSCVVTFALPHHGPQVLTMYFNVPGEEFPGDNIGRDTIWVSYPSGSAMLNEFLAIPDSGQSEFVECVLQRDIDPGPWRISDGSSEGVLSGFGGQKGEYIILGADSSWLNTGLPHVVIPQPWPSLNNSGDAIMLKDPTGKVIDSLQFTASWPLMTGRSMEKFRPEYVSEDFRSWGVSVAGEGMTPGFPNSLLVDSLHVRAKIEYYPDPFSPDGDGVDDQLWIHYHLPFQESALTIEVYDASGRKIATPVGRLMVGSEGVLTWDGRRDNRREARIGLYLIKARAEDQQSSKVWEDLQTVVLAKHLSKK